MPITTEDLMKMSAEQLVDLFVQAPPGDIPNREAKGTAIIEPATPLSPAIAETISIFASQGKTFDKTPDTLVNQITFFGVSAIEAKIYVGLSQFDGNDCVVSNYSENIMSARWVRDEIGPPDVSWNCLLEIVENNLLTAGLRSFKQLARNVFLE
jgi:hypothetical protein